MIPAGEKRHVVLLVDDEPNILRALRREILMALGTREVTVLTASSGSECLGILAELHTSVTLLISDFRMPEMSGAELVQRVSSAYPDIVLMLLTAYSDTLEDSPEAAAAVQACLMKPWDTNDLVSRVSHVLRQEAAQACAV